MLELKIVLVTMTTRLENLVAKFNTLSQAKFYVERLGADFSDYETEHQRYQRALEVCRNGLSHAGQLQILPREYLPNYLFGPDDVVVTLGRDGLVANTLKYLKGQPLLGVNPEPERWDGVLLPFGPHELGPAVQRVQAAKAPLKNVTMAQVTLGDGRRLLAVNDLFIGARSHISSRYTLSLGGQKEAQSSSGIIVSTGLGSSGWLKSVVAGAQGILDSLENRKKAPAKVKSSVKSSAKSSTKTVKMADPSNPSAAAPQAGLTIPWDADYLYYTVREPFPSRSSQAGLVFGRVTEHEPLTILSQMPEHGVIFSDGVEQDYLEFSSGTTAVITLAEQKGFLVQKN